MCPCRTNINLIVSTDRLDISFFSFLCMLGQFFLQNDQNRCLHARCTCVSFSSSPVPLRFEPSHETPTRLHSGSRAALLGSRCSDSSVPDR